MSVIVPVMVYIKRVVILELLWYISHRKSTHSKVDAPDVVIVLTDIASLCGRQRGIFYFFLLFLSLVRKARNATIKLPKAANKVSIPMKIEIISNAVILRTSLPMYS